MLWSALLTIWSDTCLTKIHMPDMVCVWVGVWFGLLEREAQYVAWWLRPRICHICAIKTPRLPIPVPNHSKAKANGPPGSTYLSTGMTANRKLWATAKFGYLPVCFQLLEPILDLAWVVLGRKTNDSKTAFATIRHLVEFTGVPDVGTIEVYPVCLRLL